MKKTLFLTSLFSLITAFTAFAQMPKIPQDANARLIQEIYDNNKDYFNSADYILDGLLKIPEEKRQYYYPMVYEFYMIPHKITSHPEIIIYKNRKPTVIAPQLAKVVEEHLDALPAMFYPILDPDRWINPYEALKGKDIIDLTNIGDLPLLPKLSAPKPDYKYPTLYEVYNVPEEMPDTFTQTNLTEEVVIRTIKTINELPAFVNHTDPDLADTLRDFLDGNIPFVMAWPFREWINHFRQTKFYDKLQSYLAVHGWKNEQEFIDAADSILKAYRASTMRLPDAMVLSSFRKEYPYKENEKYLPIQMMAELYNAKSGDVFFVKNYASVLKPTFKDADLLKIGIPIQEIK